MHHNLADNYAQKTSSYRPTKFFTALSMLGLWDLEVEFYNSLDKQYLFIDQQDGNFFSGVHISGFSEREINRTLKENEIKMQSNWVIPGDRIQTTFKGIVSSDTASGDIDMHEFLSAKFSGRRIKSDIVKKNCDLPERKTTGGIF